MTAKSFMEKHGLLDREEYLERRSEQRQCNLVSYPLEEIQYNRRERMDLNILMVSVNNSTLRRS